MSPGIVLRDPVAHLLRIRLRGPGNANGTLEVLQGFMGFHISGWVDGCWTGVLSMVGSGWVIFKLDIAPPDWVENGGDSVGYNMQTIMSQVAMERESERERDEHILAYIASLRT